MQLGEIGRGDIGYSADGEAVLLPGEPVVALGFTGTVPVVFGLGLFDEDIDDVFPAGIDQGGDSFSAGGVEAAADQRETIVGEVADGWGEIDAAGKPGFYCVLVGGFDVGEVAGLQGAEMRVDE